MNLPTPPPDQKYFAPWERSFGKIVSAFESFIHHQTTTGKVLMGCALLALIIANSPLASWYHHVFEVPLRIGLGTLTLEKSLHHWINDGLMTLFFLLVGLEIKREVLVGELADPRRAALPIVAAVGGMVFPALLFYLINPEGLAARGWGVPMATDIAFAVGVLVLLGERIPRSLILFLVALAIADDLGAVLMIALFYTAEINFNALLAAALLLGILGAFNLSGVRHPLPYFSVGIVLWLAVLTSGVHATLAGVLLAFTLPTRPKYDPLRFAAHVHRLAGQMEVDSKRDPNVLTNEALRSTLQSLANGARLVQAPSQRIEGGLHLSVALLVIPVFALANAGIPIDLPALGTAFQSDVTWGVIAGLVLGKFIGISGAAWLALRFGVAELPHGTGIRHILGVAWLGGIGFTMSIFIAELAYVGQPQLLVYAKTGVLLASLLAGTIGFVWLWLATRRPF